ncbi:glycosyltransferase family 2 protein [Shewanella sp. 202IG2-18]|nr:glycosyltransferase family 2 protein [Parashewanella hymeniacidonis]
MTLVDALVRNHVVPVIVDNASSLPVIAPCEIIHLDSNYGIAKAQNVGIEYVLEKNAEVVIFFDQDSSINDDEFIAQLYEPITNNITKISAPVFIDNERGFTYPIVEITKNGGRIKHYPTETTAAFRVNNVISSGTMVEANVLKQVGNMAEPLFIDYVDTEWCLRAYSKGFDVLIVPTARMIHSIGDKTLKIGRYYVPKHSSFRRYYRIRNAFYLLRLSYIPKRMAIREITFSIIHQWILILFSKEERLDYLKSLCRGLKDGVWGRFK